MNDQIFLNRNNNNNKCVISQNVKQEEKNIYILNISKFIYCPKFYFGSIFEKKKRFFFWSELSVIFLNFIRCIFSNEFFSCIFFSEIKDQSSPCPRSLGKQESRETISFLTLTQTHTHIYDLS